MTYRIRGLDPGRFADSAALIANGAIRMTVDTPNRYPCRVTLEDATVGETVLLLNFTSADVDTPFRATHAIYVRERAEAAPVHEDEVPAFLRNRTLSLRGFDGAGMLRDAAVAPSGAADAGIRTLLDTPEIAYVDVHHAAFGCFLARANRS